MQIEETEKCIIMLTNKTKGAKLQTSNTKGLSLRFPKAGCSEESTNMNDWLTRRLPNSDPEADNFGSVLGSMDHLIIDDQVESKTSAIYEA